MALQVSRTGAQEALAIAKHDVPVAIVMNLTGAS